MMELKNIFIKYYNVGDGIKLNNVLHELFRAVMSYETTTQWRTTYLSLPFWKLEQRLLQANN